MKKFSRRISLLLVIALVLGMFTAALSANAETVNTGYSGTVTVTSNVASPVTVDYDTYNDTVTVTYYLQSSHKIVNTQAYLDYDPDVLTPVVIDPDDGSNTPKLDTGTVIYNTDVSGKVYINASKVNFYNFTNQGIYLTQTFTINDSTNTTVALMVEYLTGSDAATASESNSTNDIHMIDAGTSMSNDYAFTCEATLSGEAPTTEEPTTEEPTTEEPTTEPVPQGATIKVVVPDSYLQTYKWDSVNLYYTNGSVFANADTLAMTKTNDVYYVNNTNANIASVVNASGWSVYSITLTPAQAAAVDNAKIAGFSSGNVKNRTQFGSASNVFKAGVGEYTDYGTTSADVATLDGYTFVICDARSASSPYTSYAGYWTSDYTTVKFAAPIADTQRSTWDAVDFCYGANASTSTDIAMVNTKETTKITDVGNMTTLKAGRWYIYAITLDAAQTEAANGSAYVGFKKPNADNKTAASKNVLKALTNEFNGTYGEYASTARTLQELEGQVFVVKARATASSLLNFNGEWQTADVYTAGDSDTVTVYFAAPIGADNTTAGWNTGVQLYYGTSTDYKTATKINMTPVNTTMAVTTNLPTLKTGDWAVYAVELDAEAITAIDAVNYVGFIKTGSYNRTSILYTRNITKASKTEDHTYSTKKQTIEAFDGYTFVIDSCADAKNERTSYLGYWK